MPAFPVFDKRLLYGNLEKPQFFEVKLQTLYALCDVA
jgi:hypothetical protein